MPPIPVPTAKEYLTEGQVLPDGEDLVLADFEMTLAFIEDVAGFDTTHYVLLKPISPGKYYGNLHLHYNKQDWSARPPEAFTTLEEAAIVTFQDLLDALSTRLGVEITTADVVETGLPVFTEGVASLTAKSTSLLWFGALAVHYLGDMPGNDTVDDDELVVSRRVYLGQKSFWRSTTETEPLSNVFIQPDGKVVTPYVAYGPANDIYFGMARFLTTGRLDPEFGTRGSIEFRPEGLADANIWLFSMVLQPDGKFLFLAYKADTETFPEETTNIPQFFRFNADGTPDTSIGAGGVMNIPYDLADRMTSNGEIYIDRNNKIVTVFIVNDVDGYMYEAHVRRWNADLTLDNTFNGGLAKKLLGAVNVNNFNDIRIIQRSDNKYLVGFSGQGEFGFMAQLFGLNEDGTSAPSLTNGQTPLMVSPNEDIDNFTITNFILTPLGGALFSGAFSDEVYDNMLMVVRYQSNWTHDTFFGPAGKFMLVAGDASIKKLLHHPTDGSVLVQYEYEGVLHTSVGFYRLTTNGVIDPLFAGGEPMRIEHGVMNMGTCVLKHKGAGFLAYIATTGDDVAPNFPCILVMEFDSTGVIVESTVDTPSQPNATELYHIEAPGLELPYSIYSDGAGATYKAWRSEVIRESFDGPEESVLTAPDSPASGWAMDMLDRAGGAGLDGSGNYYVPFNDEASDPSGVIMYPNDAPFLVTGIKEFDFKFNTGSAFRTPPTNTTVALMSLGYSVGTQSIFLIRQADGQSELWFIENAAEDGAVIADIRVIMDTQLQEETAYWLRVEVDVAETRLYLNGELLITADYSNAAQTLGDCQFTIHSGIIESVDSNFVLTPTPPQTAAEVLGSYHPNVPSYATEDGMYNAGQGDELNPGTIIGARYFNNGTTPVKFRAEPWECTHPFYNTINGGGRGHPSLAQHSGTDLLARQQLLDGASTRAGVQGLAVQRLSIQQSGR